MKPDTRPLIGFRTVYGNIFWRVTETGEEEIRSEVYRTLEDSKADQSRFESEGWECRPSMGIFARIIKPPDPSYTSDMSETEEQPC